MKELIKREILVAGIGSGYPLIYELTESGERECNRWWAALDTQKELMSVSDLTRLAHLFAAAPDLYEALDYLVRWCDAIYSNPYIKGLPEVQPTIFDDARLALQRASVKPSPESESQSEGNSNPVTDNSLIAPSTDPVKGEGK